MHKLEQQVAALIQTLNATHFFIGASGGLDSTVLIHCLNKLGVRVSIVHVNYQLRGEESEHDQRFLEEFAEHRGIPCHVKRVNLSDQLKQNGGNLQNEARKLRRAYLNRFALKDGMYVALAHHADDQVETFIINLFRGGGMMGLAAMLPKHEKIVRPLLGCTRTEIKEYAVSEGLTWREDASNASTYYLRNRIRLEWLPMIEKKNPAFRQQVLLLVKQFQLTQAELENAVQPIAREIHQHRKLQVGVFNSLTEEQQITLIRMLKFPLTMHSQLVQLVESEKGKCVPLVHEKWKAIIREADHFFFEPILSAELIGLPVLAIDEVTTLPESFSKDSIYLDPDKLVGSLKVRRWNEGDRMSPLGLKTRSGKQGSKLISDILSDAKVPHHEKSRQLVVHDDEKILWCVGFAVGAKAIASNESKKIRLSIKT
jgi:tRNA(Ile)-lysidine synthase